MNTIDLISNNPCDITIRIRAPRSIQDRLRRVAEANKRGAGKQALVAIEKHLIEEEQRLGLAEESQPVKRNTKKR